MDKTAFFILNIFLNSLLAFFTVVALIEGIIFLFRIPQGRIAASLRMLPLIKLPFDCFLYDFSKWSFVKGINPLQCAEGTRSICVTFGGLRHVFDWLLLPVNSGIQLTVAGNQTFTIADLIGYAVSPVALNLFAWLFLCVTLVFAFRKIFLYYRSYIVLDDLAKKSQIYDRKLRNPFLSSYIKKSGMRILTSPISTGSPFVAGLISSVVYIPTSLSKQLSRKEYEAVLAHEIEHVRNNDSLVRLILDFIAAIFWWIPTKKLLKYIEEGMEVGCDVKCKKYGINSTHLASAVCKSAKYSVNTPNHVFTFNLTRHTILNRVKLLLQPRSVRFRKTRFTFTCLAIGIAFLGIFFGRFWTF